MAPAAIPAVAICVMLISGAANTLLMKAMVDTHAPAAPGAAPTQFDHALVQTLLMMLGEMLCFLPLLAGLFGGLAEFRKVAPAQLPWLVLPVLCDASATTLVNVSYLSVPASVVQMTRGSIVLFTAVLSVMFIGKRLRAHELGGVLLVCLGITLVSLAALRDGAHARPLDQGQTAWTPHSVLLLPAAGIAFAVLAQAFQASMLVSEEFILKRVSATPLSPLFLVAMEGSFGCLALSLILPVAQHTGAEDVPGALYQLGASAPLLALAVTSIVSIALFNASGVTVTLEASAVARSCVDTSRTVLVWVAELAFGWNAFSAVQCLGFVLLVLGTTLYTRVLVLERVDALDAQWGAKPVERRSLLEEEDAASESTAASYGAAE